MVQWRNGGHRGPSELSTMGPLCSDREAKVALGVLHKEFVGGPLFFY